MIPPRDRPTGDGERVNMRITLTPSPFSWIDNGPARGGLMEKSMLLNFAQLTILRDEVQIASSTNRDAVIWQLRNGSCKHLFRQITNDEIADIIREMDDRQYSETLELIAQHRARPPAVRAERL